MVNSVATKTRVLQWESLTEYDTHLFLEGKHARLYQKLGAHRTQLDGREGTSFAVWAPNAKKVTVIGDFNQWDSSSHPLFRRRDSSGIWEGFIPGVDTGSLYKYKVSSEGGSRAVDKADPFSRFNEVPPRTASVVWEKEFGWDDSKWMSRRGSKNSLDSPITVYEMHVGSWRMSGGKTIGYREVAEQLSGYLLDLGFTHVE